MTTCSLIVMGHDSNSPLSDAAISDVTLSFGGAVVTRCRPCPNTSRVTFPILGGSAVLSSAAELKPRETYVFTFPTDGDGGATGWINKWATELAAKVIYLTSPAVQTP